MLKHKLVKSVVALFLLSFVLVANSVAAKPKPNILLIMAEDMSSRVGAFGDTVAITPNLDRLARTSIRFPNTFTTAGVCAPSRAAHILGVHQISVGAQHMRTRSYKTSTYRAVPPNHMKAYPELLRRHGYYTFSSAKLDYQFSGIFASSGPFTIWDYAGPKPTWQGRAQGQPFFGFVSIKQTHEGQLFPKAVLRNNNNGDRSQVVNPDDVLLPPYYPDHPAVRADIAQHYNNIYTMDQVVGQLLRRLKKDGLADNTIVIWTTDHGDGLPRGKREIYDSGIKVPLLVHWPKSLKPEGVDLGSINNKLVSFVDIGPSILTLAGIPIPDYMHGSAQLIANASPKRQYIYASKDRLDDFNFYERAVRDNQFKYIKNFNPKSPGAQPIIYRDNLASMQTLWQQLAAGKLNSSQRLWFEPTPAEALYDIQADPHEVNNLVNSAKHRDRLVQMRSALNSWRDSVGDFSETTELQMAKQFWPNGEQPITQPPKISINQSGIATIAPAATHDSMGYRINGGAWMVYKAPVSVPKGGVLEAKAVRYGWAESTLVKVSG